MALGKPKGNEVAEERWLEVDAGLTGSLVFKDPVNLQINGQFDGTLEAKGNLAIGQKARVKATIQGESVKIGGEVAGSVAATTRVELLAGARVTGKIASPRLIMHDGAVLHGTVEMIGVQPEASVGQGSWMTVEELARYLEVDNMTVVEWAQSGRLPAQQHEGRWRFERARIEEWLAHERIK